MLYFTRLMHILNAIKASIVITALLIAQGSFAQNGLSWCAYYDWRPWIYPTQNTYSGILMEQLALFEKQHSIKTLPIIRKNWKRCQVDVENGRIDMILGANKTPPRVKIFHYLPKPAFINKSTMTAYALQNNTRIQNVKNLDELAQFKLAFDRGNSYGNTIDQFIEKLPQENRRESNTMGDVFKMIIAKRKDYFFSQDSSFASSIDKYSLEIPSLKDVKFKNIISIEREIPVYIVFSKKGNKFSSMSTLWLATLNSYYQSINLKERIQFHKNNALKFEDK